MTPTTMQHWKSLKSFLFIILILNLSFSKSSACLNASTCCHILFDISFYIFYRLFRVDVWTSLLHLFFTHNTSKARQGQCVGVKSLIDSCSVGAGAHSSGRWHHPLCLSQFPWTEPCWVVAISWSGHRELHRLEVSLAAQNPHLPSLG